MLFQAKNNKFGPEVQVTLVKVPIVLGRLTLTLKVKFYLKLQNYIMPNFTTREKYTCH